ncbi:hypothetical protein E4P41_13870 [Geodermatophilus sp. DF01-2]|uniref:EsaB/YukD family protein n=1 Tax=Geodermatophilus sp. DF01-2 TaxID=2559610 RepID=UPI00107459AF|nr:EsaB/YukD family protein [Geodermatophilus sp. DF01_2]TFV57742.1 hypothetical protein E4P41_13870 [Geodermatophilus sp. DF01_2]
MPGKSDDNFFDLAVKSTSGVFTDRFNRNNKAKKVFDAAVSYFGLGSAGAVTYYLRREADGRTLDLNEQLDDLGLVDGDVLLLQTSQAQDG